jgi:cell division protein ZapA
MAQIQVTINGRSYAVACDDGQEAHVGRLARYIEQKVDGLVHSVGQVGDARLLLMASLVIADELADMELQLSHAKTELSQAASAREQMRAENSVAAGTGRAAADEALLARTLNGLADRIEAIAAGLQED